MRPSVAQEEAVRPSVAQEGVRACVAQEGAIQP